MTDENSASPQEGEEKTRWQPISAIDRRVVGVLAEKAKTTPDAYPMSLNAICNASNQKSNRSPLMKLEPDDVEESLDRLRQLGAVGMIEGYGRVTKYRHYLYEWLAVDKVELAVMAELLLRGEQTVGALRGRAARMEPIADLGTLRPILDSLKSKELVISLTPEGRGHIVTNGLLQPRELENAKVRQGQGMDDPPPAGGDYRGGGETAIGGSDRPQSPAAEPAPQATPAAIQTMGVSSSSDVVDALRGEIAEIRSQMAQFRADLADLLDHCQQTDDELNRLRDAVGGS